MNDLNKNIIVFAIVVIFIVFTYYNYLYDNTNSKTDGGSGGNTSNNFNENSGKTAPITLIVFLVLLGLFILVAGGSKLIGTFTKKPLTRDTLNLEVKQAPGDGKCMYHSLLLGLKDQKIVPQNFTVDNLMENIKTKYEDAKKSKDLILQALKDTFELEKKKIEHFVENKHPDIIKSKGYPDVGLIQTLVYYGLFPFKINLGLEIRKTGKIEVVYFNKIEDKSIPTIYITQQHGNLSHGHFDSLVSRKEPTRLLLQ